MHTKYLKIDANCTIAYDVQGEGSALILLHDSLSQNRKFWHKYGYVDKFSETHKVITIDFPHHGESTCEILTPKNFSIQFILEVIDIITQECNVKKYAVLGFSFGGVVALHIASESNHVAGVVLYDSSSIEQFLKHAQESLPTMREFKKAVEEDSVNLLDIKESLPFSKDIDLNVATILYESITGWKTINSKDINCPVCYLNESAEMPENSEFPPQIDSFYIGLEKFLNKLEF